MKAAMIKSSQTISKGTPTLLPPPSPHSLRKAQSAQSINVTTPPNPTLQQLAADEAQAMRPPPVPASRGKCMDSSRSAPLPAEPPKTVREKNKKDKEKQTAVSAQRYIDILLASSSTQLDIEIVKKLRLMLRNEPARCVCPIFSG